MSENSVLVSPAGAHEGLCGLVEGREDPAGVKREEGVAAVTCTTDKQYGRV